MPNSSPIPALVPPYLGLWRVAAISILQPEQGREVWCQMRDGARAPQPPPRLQPSPKPPPRHPCPTRSCDIFPVGGQSGPAAAGIPPAVPVTALPSHSCDLFEGATPWQGRAARSGAHWAEPSPFPGHSPPVGGCWAPPLLLLAQPTQARVSACQVCQVLPGRGREVPRGHPGAVTPPPPRLGMKGPGGASSGGAGGGPLGPLPAPVPAAGQWCCGRPAAAARRAAPTG